MKRKIILLAISNSADREFISEMLTSKGYKVEYLNDQTLPIADKLTFDAIITDAKMGMDLCAKLSQFKESTKIFLPILLLLSTKEPAEKWLNLCFDDVIRMPVSKAEFSSRVEIFMKLRTQSEQILEHSESKYKAIFEATGTATLIVEEDTSISMANKECMNVFGYSNNELVGESWTKFAAPESLENMLKNHKLRREQTELAPQKYEVKLIHKNLGERNVLLDISVIPNTKKSIVSMLDISEQRKAEGAQKESELRFKTLIEQSTEGISMTDESGTIIAWNDSMAALTGIASEEVIGQKIWDMQFRMGNKTDKNSEEYKALKKSFIQFLETGKMPFAGKQMERTLTTPAGEEKIIQGSVFPIKTAKGNLLASISHDISKRKKIEDALKESELRFKKAFHSSPIAITITNQKNGKYIEVNQAWCNIYGFTEEEAKGHTPMVLVIIDADARENIIEEIKLKGSLSNIELPLKNKKGEYRTILFSSENIELGGEPCVLSIGFDVSERKQSEIALQESEQRFEKLSNAASEGIGIETNGIIQDVSDRFCELTAYPKDELIGKPITKIFYTDDIPKALANYKQGKTEPIELRLLRKDETIKYVEVRGSNSTFKGEKARMVAIYDLTEHKQVEEKIKTSEANLKALINNREDYIWSLDRDYRYIEFNTTYADMFYNHYKTECKKGLNSLDYLSEDEKTFWVGVCERAFNGEHVKFEYSYDLGKGMQYFQTSINPIYEEDEITGLSLISVETTDQVKITQRFKALFEYAPVPLWEEDLSEVKRVIDKLKNKDVKDFRKYFDTHPKVLEKCIQAVKVLEVNQHVLTLHKAENKEELLGGLGIIFTDDSINGFKEELIAIAEGKSTAEFDSKVKTLKGNTRDIHLKWNVVPGYEETLERIYVSTEDITERKLAEDILEKRTNELAAVN